LVDERWGEAGQPATAAVPTAAIGDERRPVLHSVAPSTVLFAPLPAGGRRRSVEIPVPPTLVGRTVRVDASIPGRRASIVRQKPRMTTPAGATARVRVALAPHPPDPVFAMITVRPAPEREYVTPPLTVAPSARLRFGIGVDETAWAEDVPAVEFVLSALVEGDERTLFSRRLDPARNPADRRWHDDEVQLGRYAGQKLRLRFTTRVYTGPGVPFAYGVWSDPVVVVPGGHDVGATRNLVLVSLDTLRPDRLGCYGYGRPTSPAIDARLAARGTVFTRAYATYPGTGGSHASILTGLYPCAVVPDLAQPIHPNAATLAELLRVTGYETAAFTEDGYVIASHGFARGFGTFVESTSVLITEPTGQADVTFARGLEWVRTRRTPWFVFLHTYQVHDPYAPPPGFLERVHGDGAADTSSSARYDAEVRYTDELLGKFLDGLDRSGMADDTLIVVLSDHGEQFGEHGLTLHGNSLYDTLLHVPLILSAPRLVPEGRRIDTPVSMVDIVPTVLDLLGLAPTRWANGVSLVPLLRGDPLPPRPLYASLNITQQISVREPPFKWIMSRGTGQVRRFDLHSDPGEQHDLGPPPTGVDPALLARYDEACSMLPKNEPGEQPTLAPAVREKLKALGYVE
jgi:arylsulfatase A-like enzyme